MKVRLIDLTLFHRSSGHRYRLPLATFPGYQSGPADSPTNVTWLPLVTAGADASVSIGSLGAADGQAELRIGDLVLRNETSRNPGQRFANLQNLDTGAWLRVALDDRPLNLLLTGDYVIQAVTEREIEDGAPLAEAVTIWTARAGQPKPKRTEIALPIYHGTSDDTLLHGVGHLEGTSLPVGGAGTRSVLTAHRGLPTSRLFNDLDRAALGDTVTVTVLDRVISYRVIDVTVVEPDASEAIWPEPDRDLITLVTCTPLGINTHRILVTAERITPTPPQQAEAAAADPELPGFPWWAVWLGAGVLVVAGYVWWSGRGPAPGSSSS